MNPHGKTSVERRVTLTGIGFGARGSNGACPVVGTRGSPGVLLQASTCSVVPACSAARVPFVLRRTGRRQLQQVTF